MKTFLSLIALPALALVAGCNNEPEQIGGGTIDPMEAELANAAPVELPPMVTRSETYRCKDSSLVFIDYMSDDKTAMIRTEKDGTATALTMAEAGKPYTAEGGYALSGNGDVVDVTLPGKGAQSCKS
ncbi:MAG: hypothetical protein R3E04_02130 [Sphingobium sp.]